jgi:hypothetical protein
MLVRKKMNQIMEFVWKVFVQISFGENLCAIAQRYIITGASNNTQEEMRHTRKEFGAYSNVYLQRFSKRNNKGIIVIR